MKRETEEFAISGKTPTAKEWEAAQSRSAPQAQRCRFCDEKGHNIRTCPKYQDTQR